MNRLPEKYRDAVVLCYLEGHTNEEAAELLCWPVGTVKGRLSRARDMLRARLTRRGLAISATFLATRLSQNTVFAEVVPSRLADATTQAATALVRGGEAVGSAGVAPEVLEMVEQALAAPTRAVRATRTATVATVGGIAVTVLVAGVLFMTRGQDVRAAGASGPPAGRSGPLGSIGRAAKDSPTLAVDSASSGSSHCHIEEEPLTP
ncbi:MAG: RNA polymerase sigma factor [Isosphaeraceae bacterium]